MLEETTFSLYFTNVETSTGYKHLSVFPSAKVVEEILRKKIISPISSVGKFIHSSCQKINFTRKSGVDHKAIEHSGKVEQVCGLYKKCRDLIENRIKTIKSQ